MKSPGTIQYAGNRLVNQIHVADAILKTENKAGTNMFLDALTILAM